MRKPNEPGSEPSNVGGASNNAGQTRRGRPFERGNRAGRGRKAGSRNKATLALDGMGAWQRRYPDRACTAPTERLNMETQK